MEISQLGMNIKKFRDEKGWSLNKLKEQSGVGYATLHDIENGKSKNVNTNSIEKIATALNKATDELLGVEIETVEYPVDDYIETIKAILEDDYLKINGEIVSAEEKQDILEAALFCEQTIIRRRNSCKK
jgi:transcriptional regulator with XRE-family HTH domain